MHARTLFSTEILAAIALIATALASPASGNGTSLCDPGSQTCRTVVLDNNCTQDLWIGTMGNAASCTTDADCPTATSTCASQGCTCTTVADCASTQVCDTSQSPNNVCRYKAPLAGGAQLALGTLQTIYLPNQNYGTQPISWGGRFWARTGCPDFTTCTTAGNACTADSECCTNAGCSGLFTCQGASDCNVFTCTTDTDCPGGATCNTGLGQCNSCLGSGKCICDSDTDCRDGGTCVGNVCTGQCGAGGVACQTGDCSAELECPVGTGGQAPTTLAEFALLSGAVNYDTYDVSQVNGFNVPIMISPLGTAKAAPAGFANLQPWCGSPGCASGTDCEGQVAACDFTSEFPSCLCTWSLNEATCPDPLQAVWPMPACTSDADCGGGTCDTSTVPSTCVCRSDDDCPGAYTCGVNVNIDGKKRICGTYTGCVDADDACTADTRLKGRVDGKPFSCKRFKELYDCTGAHTGSCYTNGASAECCGCPSWSSGGNAGPFPIANGCQESNHKWARVVNPVAKSFKSTCPTAYSFQYDDPTSTFNCDGKQGSPIGYTITFCPTGSPGASG